MIPFTKPSDLREVPSDFLAVRQDEVAELLTLRTSEVREKAKRLFFTEADLELTIDFFSSRHVNSCAAGARVAVLLPGEKPDSVRRPPSSGASKMNIHVLPYGPVKDPVHAAHAIASSGPIVVGIPHRCLAWQIQEKLKIGYVQYKKHFVKH